MRSVPTNSRLSCIRALACAFPKGALEAGELCDLQSPGNMACASEICTPADVDGFFEVGVCGTRRTDDDCEHQCLRAELDETLSAGIGSRCSD